MPLSYPPLRKLDTPAGVRYQATCRTCGQDVCQQPQVVKAAVDEMRRAHGFEADCKRPPITVNIHPCEAHAAILQPSFPWHRALDMADECPTCEVTS